MVDYATLLQSLESENSWTASGIVLDLCEDEQSDFTVQVDIAMTLRKYASRREREVKLWFPAAYNKGSDDGREAVVSLCARACLPAGFSLVTKRTTSRQGLVIVSLGCSRSLIARESKGNQRLTKTKRVSNSNELCSFLFTIFFHENKKRWFLNRFGHGCSDHRGHCRLQLNEVYVPSRFVTAEELQLVQQQITMHSPAILISTLLEARNGFQLTPSQLAFLRSQIFVGGSPEKSRADQLIDRLASADNTEYCTITARMDEQKLVTVKKTRRTKSTQVDEERMQLDAEGEGYVSTVIKALSMEGNGELLLGVAWVTEDQVKSFHRFPDVLGMDCTFGTNQEKRPLFRMCGQTVGGKNIPLMDAFVPSEQGWVFRWLLHEMVPKFFPVTSLSRTSLLISDQDEQMRGQLRSAIQQRIFPNARTRLCKWHKVNNGYCNSTRMYLEADDKKFVAIMQKWFYHFCDAIESLEEEKDSSDELVSFLGSFEKKEAEGMLCRGIDGLQISTGLLTYTKTFWKNSFETQLESLCFRWYKNIPMGDTGANSFSESDNAALKKDPMGPRANDGIDTAQRSIHEHSCRRLKKLKKNAVVSLSVEQVSRESDTPLLESLKSLSKHLVGKSLVLLELEMNSSHGYHYYRHSNETYYVRKVEYPTFDSECYHPKYIRTRTVLVVTGSEESIRMKCDCDHQVRKGTTCRHIFCILDRNPILEDCAPNHLKAYEVYYGEKAAFTKACDAATSNWIVGSPVGGKTEHSLERESFDKSWFVETLDSLVECNPIRPKNTPTTRNSTENNNSDNDGDHFPENEFDGGTYYEDSTPNKDKAWHKELANDAYTKFMAKYKIMMQLVQTTEEAKVVDTKFDELHQWLLQSKMQNAIVNAHGLTSLPPTETRRKVARKKAVGEVRG